MAETRIREALELLDGGRRWMQDPKATSRSACALMALSRASGDHRFYERDRDALVHVVNEHYACHSVAVWNDLPTTTFADVELVMEKAAVLREESVDG